VAHLPFPLFLFLEGWKEIELYAFSSEERERLKSDLAPFSIRAKKASFQSRKKSKEKK